MQIASGDHETPVRSGHERQCSEYPVRSVVAAARIPKLMPIRVKSNGCDSIIDHDGEGRIAKLAFRSP
jgi:hypothetical protein